MANVIELSNIVLTYGAFVAVDDVSVDLKEGEFFALLGPSGCGKTSLLRIIAGFNTPTSGKMLLDGKDLVAIPPRHRPVNMMFQSYALFPHMTVEKNLRYGLEAKGVDSPTISKRVKEMLDVTHLDEMANRLPSQLSGGQRQRVALARALVMQPRVLLLDEPLGALDKKLREAMQLELKRLQHDLGITFVVVTHDQEEALVMADRIALMRNGKIEQLGTASDLYERPVSRFVADFVGKTNFFEGIADGYDVKIGEFGGFKGDRESRGNVTYAIRPERIRLFGQRVDSFDNSVQGVIQEVNYLGQHLHLRVAVHGKSSLIDVLQGVAEQDHQDVSINTPVWLHWNGSDGKVLTQ
ncbi:ABC transporter ATP-binding protein [Rhizobium sp. NZLR11]|uniref:ABC transporter ATP-binding protein n=1 Tax=Rhizobium sp. NZLR11 TaxID=2731098 RepID=UPI001C82F2AB|nr:ABC transporter ATP-binding protein [Rhizobium sp. NZLR11]MBX5210531.1 ABC transporter ATP-binding protein [Rhizobium sp. NZLR11]